MKKGSAFLLLMFFTFQRVNANEPLLVDVALMGDLNPSVFPQELKFEVGIPYLLVVNNNKPFTISIHYGKFGQMVATQYITGTSTMSQESCVLDPNSKLHWHFIPQVEGEYPFYASHNGTNARGMMGKIRIEKGLDEVLAEQKKEQKAKADNAPKSIEKESKGSRTILRRLFGRKD